MVGKRDVPSPLLAAVLRTPPRVSVVRPPALLGTLGLFLIVLAVAGCNFLQGSSATTGPGTGAATTLAPGVTSTGGSGTSGGNAAGTTEPTLASGGRCSTQGLGVTLQPQTDLPAPVVDMRREIFSAAMACNFARLDELSQSASGGFNFSFGSPPSQGEPGRYWQDAEARGQGVLADLVRVLNLPPGRTGTTPNEVYVWPFAQALDWQHLSREELTQLRRYFSSQEIERWREYGGYTDYRVGISGAGQWLYFVAGD